MQTITFKRGENFTLGATIDIQRDGQLTDCTVAMKLKPQDDSNVLAFTPTITDAAAGQVSYTFAAGELTEAGVYWIEFWVFLPNGNTRKAPSRGWCNIVVLDDIN